jgi:hypothetical protein
MKKRELTKLLLACACAILATTNFAQSQESRGIRPLQSTREDVQRLLGPPHEILRSGRSVYVLKEKSVIVEFSTGECDNAGINEWKAPLNTVTTVTVNPKTERVVTALHLDTKKYTKVVDKNLPQHSFYINEKEGERIEVYKEKVIGFYYEPTAKDSPVRCANSLAARCARGEIICDPRVFDLYGDIAFDREQTRLNVFAIWLKDNPDMQGYIIAYGQRGGSAAAARSRTNRAKNYLLKSGIEAARVLTIVGGFREQLNVELWSWPRGRMAPPVVPLH